MKNRLLVAVALVMVLVGVCGAEQNVVRNGDFSLLNKDSGLPAEWFNGFSRGEGEFFADAKVVKVGAYSYRIDGYTGDSHGQIGQRLTNEEVTPGKVYRVSMWYRTERLELSALRDPFRVPVVVRIRFYDANGAMTATDSLIRTDKPEHVVYYGNMHFGVSELSNGAWLPFEADFAIPSEMTYMYVEVFLWHAPGTLWLDDIQMTPINQT